MNSMEGFSRVNEQVDRQGDWKKRLGENN